MSKRKIVSFLLLLLLTVSFFIANIIIIENAKGQLPDVTQLNYNKNSGASPKTISKMEWLFNRISNDGIAFCSEGEETIEKEEAVTPVFVNENWFTVYKAKINGKNISAQNIKNKDKVAVIGSQLALKLYFTTDAAGKKININGSQYTICGVICENEGFINKLSSDSKQRVYIPYTTAEKYVVRTADTIAYDNSAYTAAIVEQMDLPQYYSVNLNDKNQTLSSFEHILYLAIFIGFSIIALKLWYRFSRKFFEEIKENLKLNYFLKSLKNIPLKYVALVLVFAGIPVLLLVVFSICDFSIFIPSKYIPNDNIFDISHYINMIIDNAKTVNSLSLTGDTLLINLFSRTFTVSLWLTIIFLICLCYVICELCAVFCKFLKK